MLLHRGRAIHPEKPERVTTALERLNASGLLNGCVKIPAREATQEELLAVHTSGHIARVAECTRAVEENPDDQALREPQGDGAIYYHETTERAARSAAGCVIEAVDATLRGKVRSAFALVRPPGHHAEADEALGFCFYNTVPTRRSIACHHCAAHCERVFVTVAAMRACTRAYIYAFLPWLCTVCASARMCGALRARHIPLGVHLPLNATPNR